MERGFGGKYIVGGILLWCEGISRLVEEVLEKLCNSFNGVKMELGSLGSGQFIALLYLFYLSYLVV